jgi:hypothetical protein
MNAYLIPDSNLNLARKCLALIRDIALQELNQVLFERTGSQERAFEPVSAELLAGLRNLHEELALVDSFSDHSYNVEIA